MVLSLNSTILGVASALSITALLFFLRKVTSGIYRMRYHQIARLAYARWSLLDRGAKEHFLRTRAAHLVHIHTAAQPLADQLMDELFSRYLNELHQQMERAGVRDAGLLHEYLTDELARESA